MTEEQELYERQQARLLEIYKLQTQIANDVSNRRVMVNRYYTLVMSGISVVLAALLRENIDILPIESIMLVVGLLGIALSFAWCNSTDTYLLQNSRKYEVLKDLESKLEYQFLQQEWKQLGLVDSKKTYAYLSRYELFVPLIFYIFFAAVFMYAIWLLSNGERYKLIGILVYVSLLLVLLLSGSFFFRRMFHK